MLITSSTYDISSLLRQKREAFLIFKAVINIYMLADIVNYDESAFRMFLIKATENERKLLL